MTQGECAGMLAIAGRVYGRVIDPELIRDWAEALHDIPVQLGIKAMRAHVRNAKWFPVPAEIRLAAQVAKPAVLYLPPVVKDPVPAQDVRLLVEQLAKNLKGGGHG